MESESVYGLWVVTASWTLANVRACVCVCVCACVWFTSEKKKQKDAFRRCVVLAFFETPGENSRRAWSLANDASIVFVKSCTFQAVCRVDVLIFFSYLTTHARPVRGKRPPRMHVESSFAIGNLFVIITTLSSVTRRLGGIVSISQVASLQVF